MLIISDITICAGGFFAEPHRPEPLVQRGHREEMAHQPSNASSPKKFDTSSWDENEHLPTLIDRKVIKHLRNGTTPDNTIEDNQAYSRIASSLERDEFGRITKTDKDALTHLLRDTRGRSPVDKDLTGKWQVFSEVIPWDSYNEHTAPRLQARYKTISAVVNFTEHPPSTLTSMEIFALLSLARKEVRPVRTSATDDLSGQRSMSKYVGTTEETKRLKREELKAIVNVYDDFEFMPYPLFLQRYAHFAEKGFGSDQKEEVPSIMA